MIRVFLLLSVLISTSALSSTYSSCDLNSIMDEVKSCFPKQECPECKDPVCPEPVCPEPKCPDIPPFPECPKPKDDNKCEEAAKQCEQTAQKCEEKQESKERKCEESRQTCEQAQKETEMVEEELEAVAEEVTKLEDELEDEREKSSQLEKALNLEKQARIGAEKIASQLEKALRQMEEDKKKKEDNPSVPEPEVDPGQVLEDLLKEVNKVREEAKVSKLYISTRLQCAADRHSLDMGKTKICSHTGSDGSTAWDRASKCGTKAYGEIIACGQKTPKQAVEGWMGSPSHKRILLNGKFKSVGLGMSNNHWTAIFGY